MEIKYNETAIRMGGDFAERFFNDFNSYKDKFKPQILFFGADFETIKKRNALDNYILKNYDKANVFVQKSMDKYLSAFYRNFLLNPTELLGSPFLKSPEIVNKFCPEIVETNNKKVELRKNVKSTYRENTKDSQALYIRDRNSGNLSREETNRLMHYFINNIGTEKEKVQEAQEEYIKRIIGENKKTKDLLPKQIEFIARYVNNYMLNTNGYGKKGIQANIYVGEEEESLGGFENKYNIYINKNSVLTQTIPELIQTVCHETEHSIQKFEATENPKSKVGLDQAISTILRRYFQSENGYDVYHNNYRFQEIEKDAEEKGRFTAAVFLGQMGFNKIATNLSKNQNEKNNRRQFEYDFRKDERGKKSVRENFIYNNLNKAVAQNPNLINEYPGLELLYNREGKVKSFKEILMQDFKANDAGQSDAFNDFCKVYISQGELEKIDLNEFQDEMQANIASRLIYVLSSETSQISKMDSNKEHGMRMKQPIKEEDQIHVEKFHLKNSKNIMEFINRNYQQLMKLQNTGKFSSIINMDYYDSNVRFYTHEGSYKKLAFDDKAKIDDIIRVAKEAVTQKEISRNDSKFTSSTIESSFERLIDNTKLSGFQQSTRDIRNATELINTKEQEVEEK